MDLSLLLPSPSAPRILPYPTLAPLRFSSRRKLRSCRRSSLTVRGSASEGAAELEPPSNAIFGGRKELTGTQALAESLPPSVRLAGSAVVVVGALAAGYGLGVKSGAGNTAAIGGAAVLGAAAGAAAYAVNAAVPEVAAANLHNLVAGHEDPATLRKEEVEAVAKKYGISKEDEAFTAELCDLYSRYVLSVLPSGGENLIGDEVEKIIKFKNGLGIDDPEAASVHMEIGRRIFRERLETGDREADVEQRRAFQKLVYVSTLVFGEASVFLLPWKRVFKVTDSQVEIAVRDNAQKLYSFQLNSLNRDIDEKILLSLREYQLRYKLSDEIAAEMLRGRVRKLAEENVSAALEVVKSRTRASGGLAQVIEELEKVLAFNNTLTCLSQHSEAGRFAVGVGPVSLLGGEYDGDRKIDDLKLLYRSYATESLARGRLEDEKIVSLNHLRNIFGLGKREAEAIVVDVTSKVYRKRLSQAVSSGDLDIATSKAAYLQKICEELHFDPQMAATIHEEIYRQKLQNSVADGELSQDDVSALLRLRVKLCIPQETVDSSHADICGTLFEKAYIEQILSGNMAVSRFKQTALLLMRFFKGLQVVKDAVASGTDGYTRDVRTSVKKASKGLRLTKDAAMAIASKAVRKVFLSYIQRSRASSRSEAVRELKKMVSFNTLVVTELISDIKDEPIISSEKVEEDKQVEMKDEWEEIATLKKTKDRKLAVGKAGQTEITLKDDLPERDRADLYKSFLLHCLTGETVLVPFGMKLPIKKDDSDFFVLNQLGGILGLSDKETLQVHRSLAEQAFTKRAEVILADGNLTKEKIEELNSLQKEIGLPAAYAQNAIKKLTTSKMAAAVETAVGQGRLDIKQVRELKEAGVDLESIVSENLRENLFKKIVDGIFSSGKGEFDEVEVYEKMPKDLAVNAEKARKIVQDLAKARISSSLVQAVALMRQRNRERLVSSLKDLLACDKAVPSEPLSWSSPEELGNLYSIYMKSIPEPEKLLRLQYLLGISDSTAANLRDSAERGDLLPSLESEEEEFAF